MIEGCQFGKMVIDGQGYDADLWILPGGDVRPAWRRKQGHRLVREDIARLIDTQPEVLVVGTGIFGRMRIDDALAADLRSRQIELRPAWTKAAAEIYNRLRTENRRVAACFHLTC